MYEDYLKALLAPLRAMICGQAPSTAQSFMRWARALTASVKSWTLTEREALTATAEDEAEPPGGTVCPPSRCLHA